MQEEVRRAGGWRAVCTAAAGVLLAAACSQGEGKAVPRVTVPLATTTTDPYAPPPVIDAAYVNRVLAGLDQVVGDVVRMVVRDRALTPEAEAYLRAVYSDEGNAFADQRDGLRADVDGGLVDARPNPGNQVTTVSRLVSARGDCIFAQVQRDLSPIVYKPNPELTVQWVGLKPLDRSRDPGHVNPTPWMYVFDGLRKDYSQPEDPCAGP